MHFLSKESKSEVVGDVYGHSCGLRGHVVTGDFWLALVGGLKKLGVFSAKKVDSIGADVVVVAVVDAWNIKTGSFAMLTAKVGLVEDALVVHQSGGGFDKYEELAVVPPCVGAGANGNVETVAGLIAVFSLGGKEVVLIEDCRPLNLEQTGTT